MNMDGAVGVRNFPLRHGVCDFGANWSGRVSIIHHGTVHYLRLIFWEDETMRIYNIKSHLNYRRSLCIIIFEDIDERHHIFEEFVPTSLNI